MGFSPHVYLVESKDTAMRRSEKRFQAEPRKAGRGTLLVRVAGCAHFSALLALATPACSNEYIEESINLYWLEVLSREKCGARIFFQLCMRHASVCHSAGRIDADTRQDDELLLVGPPTAGGLAASTCYCVSGSSSRRCRHLDGR